MAHLFVYDFLSLTSESKVYCTIRVALIKAGYSLVQPCRNRKIIRYSHSIINVYSPSHIDGGSHYEFN